MKKLIIAIAATCTLAFGYCTILSLKSQRFQYGHMVCTYSDGTTTVSMNVRMGEVCPSYIQYDQWSGQLCE